MYFTLINKIIKNLRLLKQHPITAQFIKHNKRVFPVPERFDDKQSIVLMEFNTMNCNIISYSYLATALRIENEAIIKSYMSDSQRGFLRRINFKLFKFFGSDAFGAYTSFGSKDFITIELDPSQKEKAQILSNS